MTDTTPHPIGVLGDLPPLPPLPVPNLPLLRKAVEWAEAEAAKPKGQCLWEQYDYVTEKPCGTAYCIAGFAVVNGAGNYYLPDGEPVYWHGAGMEVLGLTGGEAEDLFNGENGIEKVREVAERIAARAGERL